MLPAILSLVATANAIQLVPIPLTPQGYGLGNPHANFTVDVFYDNLCSDSRNSYPGFKQYIDNHSEDLYVRIHIFPLPYHHATYYVAEAGKFVQE